MSLNKEIEALNKERLEVGEQSRAHYNSIDLPGDRTMTVETLAVRKRIAAMKKEREDAGQENPIK